VDLDTFIVAVFCAVEDGLAAVLGGRRLRQRGPAPVLTDGEVLAMEIVGEFLGLEQDAAIYRYFRRHWLHFFPSTASACTCACAGRARLARCCLTPANISETAALPHLLDGTDGVAVGDRNYGGARTADEASRAGVVLLAPCRKASQDPTPARSALISRVRYRIDTVFGQLAERFRVKRVWAQDPWHLWSRLLRKLLSHTLALLLNAQAGNPPLQIARLVA
jgi:hypothetical protein